MLYVIARGCLIFGFWLLTMGCSFVSHAVIKSPEPEASLDERLDTYDELRPTETMDANFGNMNHFTNLIKLGDGTLVYDPTDLLPVVSKDSETARSVQASKRYWKNSRYFLMSFLVDITAALASAAIAGVSSDDTVFERGLVVAGGLGVLSIPLLIGTKISDDHFLQAREKAFQSYDFSLQQYLHLCQSGKELVDCRTTPTPITAPQEAGDALSN